MSSAPSHVNLIPELYNLMHNSLRKACQIMWVYPDSSPNMPFCTESQHSWKRCFFRCYGAHLHQMLDGSTLENYTYVPLCSSVRPMFDTCLKRDKGVSQTLGRDPPVHHKLISGGLCDYVSKKSVLNPTES